MTSADDTTPDALKVSFPVRSGYLRICRLAATTVAADAGFDVDTIDDLRLAVDEAMAWLLSDPDAGGTAVMTIADTGDGIDVSAERADATTGDGEVDDLVDAILGATLDHYELTFANGRRSFALRLDAADRGVAST